MFIFTFTHCRGLEGNYRSIKGGEGIGRVMEPYDMTFIIASTAEMKGTYFFNFILLFFCVCVVVVCVCV